MNTATITLAQTIALEDLQKVIARAGREGIVVFAAARIEEADGGTYFHTQIAVPDGMNNEMLDHCFADAIRDQAREWSNHRHDSKLEWATK